MTTSKAPGFARKIPHRAIVSAPGLLPMLYKAAELAEDLGVPLTMVKTWMRQGLPHQRDARNHLWLIGTEVARWIEEQRKKKRGPELKTGEAYCLRCRKAVPLLNPTQHIRAKRTIISGSCPDCGSTVNRGMKHDQSK